MQAIPQAQLLRLEDLREKVNIALEGLIQRELDNGAGEVAKLSGEILLSGGKRLRPLLGIFCYEVAGGLDLDEIMDLAIAFELIHTATLIHDDINDAAKLPSACGSNNHKPDRIAAATNSMVPSWSKSPLNFATKPSSLPPKFPISCMPNTTG